MITAVDDCGLCQFAEVIIPPGPGDPAGTEPRTTFVVDVAGYSVLLNDGTILKLCAGDIVIVTGEMAEDRRISTEAQAILD
ncbi:hypothetical protein KC614_04700, partial [candidate division WWE3 bacterium]|nr:hypothetical protein [candidate division WWE3 bacterium]